MSDLLDDLLIDVPKLETEDFVQFGFSIEPPDTPWLTPQEAAGYLKVSLRKLETLREDTPPSVPAPWRKLGRTVRWNRNKIDGWVDSLSRTKAGRRRR